MNTMPNFTISTIATSSQARTVIAVLEAMLQGQPVPAPDSPQMQALHKALRELAADDDDQHGFVELGIRCCAVVVAHLKAGLSAERALLQLQAFGSQAPGPQ